MPDPLPLPPRSDLEIAADRWLTDLERNASAAQRALVHQWATAWHATQATIDDLATRIRSIEHAGGTVDQALLARLDEAYGWRAEITRQLTRYWDTVRAITDPSVVGAARLGQAQAEDLTRRAADTMTAPHTRAAMRVAANTLAPGSPLQALLAGAPQAAVDAMWSELIQGIMLGRNPLDVARRMRARADGMNLARSVTIARTEMLRAQRQASQIVYAANTDVLAGWIWSAHLDLVTCGACWAMHGTVHPVSETLDGHPRCRCTMVPLTRGDRASQPVIVPGADTFRRLPAAMQDRVLGRKGGALYRSGDAALSDWVTRRRSKAWGSMRVQASLAEVRAQRTSAGRGGRRRG